MNEEAHVHLDVVSDFWVFRPTEGKVLRGVVNRKSPNHVACLVHGCFNVACNRPHDQTVQEWCGSRARMGKVM